MLTSAPHLPLRVLHSNGTSPPHRAVRQKDISARGRRNLAISTGQGHSGALGWTALGEHLGSRLPARPAMRAAYLSGGMGTALRGLPTSRLLRPRPAVNSLLNT